MDIAYVLTHREVLLVMPPCQHHVFIDVMWVKQAFQSNAFEM